MLELSIVLLTVGLLIFFGLMHLSQMRRLSARNPLQCQQNLKWIGVALADFNADHSGKMPWELPAEEGGSREFVATTQVAPHFKTLTNFIRNTRILACPMDPVRNRKTNLAQMDDSALSYFVNVNATAEWRGALLAGDRTVSNTPDSTTGELRVQASQTLQWTYPVPDDPGHTLLGTSEATGNLLFNTGSVLETTTPQLQRVVLSAGSKTLVLMLP